METHELRAAEGGMRLDVFLSQQLSLTRSAAKKLIDEGHVSVNGAPAKASHAVAAGETVTAHIPPPQQLDLTPQDIPIRIEPLCPEHFPRMADLQFYIPVYVLKDIQEFVT